MSMVPEAVTELQKQLKKTFLDSVVLVDIPKDPEGVWYIDAMLEEIWAVIGYWPKAPAGIYFGLTYKEGHVFGSGPDETFSSIEALLARLIELEKGSEGK